MYFLCVVYMYICTILNRFSPDNIAIVGRLSDHFSQSHFIFKLPVIIRKEKLNERKIETYAQYLKIKIHKISINGRTGIGDHTQPPELFIKESRKAITEPWRFG